ncbi:hypothetical protein HPB48_024953 [Haemaphysalis longicornis]|uniref:Uncharacterized protein n=1 Tax=Haemaphysalis longicornis TaxID=44386 RepID=A0A9J6H862_HAELO|nr:hypothetical protein HPB48_024953 [Haemaphysalis longicornis]
MSSPHVQAKGIHVSSDPIDMPSAGAHYGSTNNAPPPVSRFWFGNDESVLERLRQAREEYPDHDPQEVAAAVLAFCLGTGTVYINQCPHQPMVPVLLVLSGVVTLLSGVVNIAVRSGRLYPADCEQETTERKYVVLGAVTGVLNVAMFVIFVTGCVYVYGSLWPSHDPASAHYCSSTAFYFAFWLHNAAFIFLGFLLQLLLVDHSCSSWDQLRLRIAESDLTNASAVNEASAPCVRHCMQQAQNVDARKDLASVVLAHCSYSYVLRTHVYIAI